MTQHLDYSGFRSLPRDQLDKLAQLAVERIAEALERYQALVRVRDGRDEIVPPARLPDLTFVTGDYGAAAYNPGAGSGVTSPY